VADLDTKSHPRQGGPGKYVYLVKSRRAGGLSLGINLNADKKCNFDCAYCQVQRSSGGIPNPSIDEILSELEPFLKSYQQAGHWQGMQIKDFALAGDGEPSLFGPLPELLNSLMKLKTKYQLSAKIVLFTNGAKITRLDLDSVWPQYFGGNNQVWFKLDFWDQPSYLRVNGAKGDRGQVLEKLLHLGQRYPLTLQACFFKPEALAEVDLWAAQAWVDQLKGLLNQGLKVEKLQIYTLARPPKEKQLAPYSLGELNQIGSLIRSQLNLDLALYA